MPITVYGKGLPAPAKYSLSGTVLPEVKYRRYHLKGHMTHCTLVLSAHARLTWTHREFQANLSYVMRSRLKNTISLELKTWSFSSPLMLKGLEKGF